LCHLQTEVTASIGLKIHQQHQKPAKLSDEGSILAESGWSSEPVGAVRQELTMVIDMVALEWKQNIGGVIVDYARPDHDTTA
jgi:hypothetical protein